jgi:ADP-heptose:LPS heptosyltransferase
VLSAFLQQNRNRFLLNDPVLPEKYFALLDRFSASDVRAYPNEALQLQLLRMEALILAGRNDDALALSTPLAERPYLIEGDLSSLSKLYELDTLARLNLGHRLDVEAVALGRLLLLVRLRPAATRSLFRSFSPMLAVGSVASTQYSFTQPLIRLAARLRLYRSYYKNIWLHPLAWIASVAAVWILRWMARQNNHLKLQLLAGVPPASTQRWATDQPLSLEAWFQKLFRPKNYLADEVLVTRAMGGLGDIMMMTPGLEALAKRIGHPVNFATKRQFFPVLENNPSLHLLDIDSIIDLRRFRRWINLSFCPAARYESRVTPKIQRGRVELFSRAMGVPARALSRRGLRPSCPLSSDQLKQRDEYHVRFREKGLPVIGVQPFSREIYRNYPGIFDAMARLSDDACIVFFHGTQVPAGNHPNVIQLHGQPLQRTLAAVAACDYFVCVDSAFLHVAAAFDIPTLGIFGPTLGRLRSSHHPRAIAIEAPAAFPCAPCWRNEDTPCYLSGGRISVCLSGISPEVVASQVTKLMRLHKQGSSIGITR